VLVWTVNGEAVKDKDGKVVPVSATPQAPEFKYDKGAWYYRVGEGEWVACTEGETSPIEVVELDDVVLITIGDTIITLPKESVSAAIKEIKVKPTRKSNVFVPVGQSVDLKTLFDVVPAEAPKSMVSYTYAEGAFTIDKDGVLTVTDNTVKVNEANHVAVTISSKADPDVKAVINVRTCPAPKFDEEVATPIDVPAEDKTYLFDSTLDGYNGLASLGGAGCWAPLNNAIGALIGAGGLLNTYFTVNPINPGITRANGHLHFMIYLSTVDNLNFDGGQIEISSNTADHNELSWSTSVLKSAKVGWNEVNLSFKDASVTDGDCDLSAIKWFRVYVPTSIQHDQSVMIKDAYIYRMAPAIPEGAYPFHSCDNLSGFTKGADANRTVEIVTTGQKEGTGWYKSTLTKQPELIVINTPALNASALTKENGHLVFWFYVSEENGDARYADNAAAIKARISGGRIEVSSGQGSNKGIGWDTAQVFKAGLKMGWNKFDLKFSDATVYGYNFTLDTSKLDWFRVFWNGPVALYDKYTFGFDNVYFYAEE
jgi:hypothetical protein